MLKKLFYDSFIYAFLPKLPIIASIFIMPFTTRYLTPEDYGINGVIMAYFGILIGFRELGLGVILTNSFYKHNKYYELIWRNIMGFLYVWGVIYALAFGLLLYLVFPTEAESFKWMIMGMILFPMLVFTPVQRIARQFYQLKRKPIPVTFI
jgi:O-antigen/teichoic acid export membrane protein